MLKIILYEDGVIWLFLGMFFKLVIKKLIINFFDFFVYFFLVFWECFFYDVEV